MPEASSSHNSKYFLCAVSSYVIWGVLPLFLKQLHAYNGFEIIFYRILIAALLLLPILIVNFGHTRRIVSEAFRKPETRPKFYQMLFLTISGAALLALNWVTYVYTVNHVSISAAAFGYMILPITAALLALVIFKEKLTPPQWVAIILSVISCYILGNVNIKEIIFVLIISFSYSFYMITQRKNVLLPRTFTIGLQMIIGTFLMLFVLPASHSLTELPAHFWFYITFISAFLTILPLLLNLYALHGMKTAQVSYLVYINPTISFIIGIMLYNEKMNQQAVFAYSLLTVAVVIFNWNSLKKLSSLSLSK